jgi:cob(I)alamin adenosyltransferase
VADAPAPTTPPSGSIYTRAGDRGTTALGANRQVQKDSQRVHTLGDVDELNSQLGVVASFCIDDDIKQLLQELQRVDRKSVV